MRLRALVRSSKTSEDDLFSLLAALGDDVVGDVWCAPIGPQIPPAEALVDGRSTEDLRFGELFERATRGEDRSTFAGVQPKVSAGRLTLPASSGSRGCSHLLKLPSEEYPCLVRNEAFCMDLARATGLLTAHVEIVRDRSGAEGLLVERFDRSRQPRGGLVRHHVEDLCQLLGRYPADKYRVSLSDACRALEGATAPMVERLRLIELHGFSYVIAGGDLHGKNASLLSRGGKVRLSPAYDLVSTLPYGDEHVAMGLDDKDARLKRRDFVAFGSRIGLRERAVEGMLDRLVRGLRRALGEGPGVGSIGFDERTTTLLETEMRRRLDALSA